MYYHCYYLRCGELFPAGLTDAHGVQHAGKLEAVLRVVDHVWGRSQDGHLHSHMLSSVCHSNESFGQPHQLNESVSYIN